MSRRDRVEVVANTRARRRIECESAGSFWSYNSYGELQREPLRAKESVSALDEAPNAGRCLPQGGLDAGRWHLAYHGPNISVVHKDHPHLPLLLDADGFELQPGASPTAIIFDLPRPPILKVLFCCYVSARACSPQRLLQQCDEAMSLDLCAADLEI